jgi:hypothetical protein
MRMAASNSNLEAVAPIPSGACQDTFGIYFE